MIKQARRIERIHDLVKRKSTGCPSDLATKLQISERQVYNLIDLMKDMGAPLVYDPFRKSYVYTSEVKWEFGFKQPQEFRKKVSH